MLRSLLYIIITTLSTASNSDVGWARKETVTKGPADIWVMVIDSGIMPHSKLGPYVQYEDSSDYIDNLGPDRGFGHGTHVAGIVAYGNENLNDPICNRVKIFSCKAFIMSRSGVTERTENCFKLALKNHMDYVNYSGGGVDFNPSEYKAILDFTKSGGVVVAAAGNEHSEMSLNPYYPASYAYKDGVPNGYKPIVNLIPVANIDKYGNFSWTSNIHDNIDKEVGVDVLSTFPGEKYAKLSGTSMASPAHLHKLLKEKCNGILFAKGG